jgi:hypothetical protein
VTWDWSLSLQPRRACSSSQSKQTSNYVDPEAKAKKKRKKHLRQKKLRETRANAIQHLSGLAPRRDQSSKGTSEIIKPMACEADGESFGLEVQLSGADGAAPSTEHHLPRASKASTKLLIPPLHRKPRPNIPRPTTRDCVEGPFDVQVDKDDRRSAAMSFSHFFAFMFSL